MKKLLTLTLILPLALSLAGCGKSEPKPAPSTSSTPRFIGTPSLPAPVQTPDVRPSETAPAR